VFEFEAATYNVAESAAAVALTVRRVAGSDGSANVDYATVPETATADADYTSISGTLDFAAGETERSLSVSILDDAELEGAETFRVELSNPTGGAILGTPSATQVTIGDDEAGYDLALELAIDPIYTNRGGAGWDIDVDITITARNLGPGIATDAFVQLAAFAASNGDYVYVTDDSGGSFTQNVLAQWNWQIGALGANETRSMTAKFAKVDPAIGAAFTLSGEIREGVPQPEPDLDNNSVYIVVPVSGADLGVTMVASKESVTNAGATFYDAIYDVNVSYAAPAEEPGRNAAFYFKAPGSIISFDPALAECAKVSGSAGHDLECLFTELTQAFSLKIRVSVSGPQTATAEASIVSDSYDPDETNNMIDASVEIPDPAIQTQANPFYCFLHGYDEDRNCEAPRGALPCFIATAAYGTPWEPNVVSLRKFRDDWLLTNAPGRAFVAFYYRNSPPIADWIAEREWARALTRGVLTPLVLTIQHPAVAGSALASLLLFVGWVRRRRVALHEVPKSGELDTAGD